MKAFLGYLALLCLIVVWIVTKPTDPIRDACLGIEWELQNAAICLARPEMWDEWSRLGKVYGRDDVNTVGNIGCPVFISKIEKYRFMTEDGGVLLNYFVEAYRNGEEISVRHGFKQETGRDFCEVAEEKGWTAQYIQMKNDK